MEGPIKREDVAAIEKKLEECRLHLKKRNLYSSLINFKDVLEKSLHLRMLPQDAKRIMADINEYQQTLSSSEAFREVYGPVTFRDNDAATSLNFINQLIQLKEEEFLESLDLPPGGIAPETPEEEKILRIDEDYEEGSLSDPAVLNSEAGRKAIEAIHLLDKGEFGDALDAVTGDERACALVLQTCNVKGISLRKLGDFDKAIAEYRKALHVAEDDEGLYYNIARAYYEKKEWQDAINAMDEGLRLNPGFPEGRLLLKYLRFMRDSHGQPSDIS